MPYPIADDERVEFTTADPAVFSDCVPGTVLVVIDRDAAEQRVTLRIVQRTALGAPLVDVTRGRQPKRK